MPMLSAIFKQVLSCAFNQSFLVISFSYCSVKETQNISCEVEMSGLINSETRCIYKNLNRGNKNAYKAILSRATDSRPRLHIL